MQKTFSGDQGVLVTVTEAALPADFAPGVKYSPKG